MKQQLYTKMLSNYNNIKNKYKISKNALKIRIKSLVSWSTYHPQMD